MASTRHPRPFVRTVLFISVALALTNACTGPSGDGGPRGPVGPQGERGPLPKRDIAPGLVYPNEILLGRTTEVALTFHGTYLDDAVTVDAGDGVAVASLRIVSPTTLYVELTTAATAASGLRDISVRTPDETIHFTDGIELLPAISLQHVDGDLSRGSFAVFEVANHDSHNDLDGGNDGVIFSLPHLALIAGDELYSFSVLGRAAPDRARVLAKFSPKAPPSTRIDAINRSGSVVLQHFVGETVDIAVRRPTELTPGAVLEAERLDRPFASGFYKLTVPHEPAIVTVQVFADETGVVFPVMNAFASSGMWDDQIYSTFGRNPRVTYPVTVSRNGGDAYFGFWDGYLGGGDDDAYGYRVVTTRTPIPLRQQLTERPEPNDTSETAQRLSPDENALVFGTFDRTDDVDTYSFELAKDQAVEVTASSDVDLALVFQRSSQTFRSTRGILRVAMMTCLADQPGVNRYFVKVVPNGEVVQPERYVMSVRPLPPAP